VYRRRKLGLADERPLRRRQVDEDKIGGSKRTAMFLVPADSPHLRPQKRGGLFPVPVGDVEQIERHHRMVPASRAGTQTPILAPQIRRSEHWRRLGTVDPLTPIIGLSVVLATRRRSAGSRTSASLHPAAVSISPNACPGRPDCVCRRRWQDLDVLYDRCQIRRVQVN
jgi:hypothetical protein